MEFGSLCLKISLSLSLIFNVTMIIVSIIYFPTCTYFNEHPTCSSPPMKPNFETPNMGNIFSDLSSDELDNVLRYLFLQESLNLVMPSQANMSSSYVFMVELLPPSKVKAVDYLDLGGPIPVRRARAIIFRGDIDPQVVEEYVVEPVSEPSTHYLHTSVRKKNPVEYKYRPYNMPEMLEIFYKLIQTFSPKLDTLFFESYGAGFGNIADKRLSFVGSPVSSVEHDRKIWFSLQHDVGHYSFYPVDFQFLLNLKDSNSTNWLIEKIWYSNELYDSIDDLILGYQNGTKPKTRLKYPDPIDDDYFLRSTSNNFRQEHQSGPRQYDTNGHRYTVNEQYITYFQWSFNFRMSTISGPQLFDVRFGNERIIYELSLQEIVVLYSGHGPTMMFAAYADSVTGLGHKAFGLFPGIDCPEHSTFINTTHLTEFDETPSVYYNAFCLFEHNRNIPLKRHHSEAGAENNYYTGMPDDVLILRTVIVVNNYDYIFDFIFSQNGAIEVRVHATGFVMNTFRFPDKSEYGFPIGWNTTASMHRHIFNFKVDLDIKGMSNRYETIDIKLENVTNNWRGGENAEEIVYQNKIERNLRKTEKEATVLYNYDKPSYHVFLNQKHTNKYGSPMSYRILHNGMSRELRPPDSGILKTLPWTHYQMAVTKRKEEEERSSSMFATFDADDPVVDFQGYIDDDDDIVDQDLVAWITLGLYHIPSSEDVPLTTSTGNGLAFYLLPFNYFSRDPAIHSTDAVYVSPSDDVNILDGIIIERHQLITESCLPLRYDFAILGKDSSTIFK